MKFNFDGQTSDGGALLLALAAPKIGLIEALARCIRDPRQPGKVDHPIEELGARVVETVRRIVLSCPKAYPSVLALGVIVRRLRPLTS